MQDWFPKEYTIIIMYVSHKVGQPVYVILMIADVVAKVSVTITTTRSTLLWLGTLMVVCESYFAI